jgi:hypothetical protein
MIGITAGLLRIMTSDMNDPTNVIAITSKVAGIAIAYSRDGKYDWMKWSPSTKGYDNASDTG